MPLRLHFRCFAARFYRDRDKAKNVMCMYHWMGTRWYKAKLRKAS